MDGLAVGLRATATGRCFFFLRYGPKGAQRRMTLGEYPTMTLEVARGHARALRDDAQAGADPLAQRAAVKAAARAEAAKPPPRPHRDQTEAATLLRAPHQPLPTSRSTHRWTPRWPTRNRPRGARAILSP
jgi:hypothetical protein